MDYSERFLAYLSGTRAQNGADPHVVAEHARKVGIPLETQWPSKGMANLDAYYQAPPAKIYEYARQFITDYTLGHDTVPCIPEQMINALRYSPLGISVRFDREENGIYRKEGGGVDTHWVTIYGYDFGKYWKVFDSAPPHFKKLAWNHQAQLVKRYVLTKKVDNVRPLYFRLIELLKRYIGILTPVAAQIAPPVRVTPDTTPSPEPRETPSERLYNAAYRSIGKDLSKRAPDERGCAESLSRIIRMVDPTFPIYVSTIELAQHLKDSPDFEIVKVPQKGDIAIFPTRERVGHCGVVGKTHIMSNNSKTGNWEANYTHAEWRYAYQARRLTNYFFRMS
jgi:hypothetical protein